MMHSKSLITGDTLNQNITQQSKQPIAFMKAGIQARIYNLTYIFILGMILGWAWEVLWKFFSKGILVNRGVLHGPWLPIYGTGCVLMVLLSYIFKKRINFLAASMIICGIIEYVASWLLETVYHSLWWDYSKCFLNLHGRIFLGGLIFFGVAGYFVVYKIIPPFEKLLVRIPAKGRVIIIAIISLVFLIDIAFSLIAPNMGNGITV